MAAADAFAAPAPAAVEAPSGHAAPRACRAKHVLVPLCALYALYTLISYALILAVVVLSYREQQALNATEGAQRPLSASATAGSSFNSSATDLVASRADVLDGLSNYTSDNATGLDGDDVEVPSNSIDCILLNYTTVDECSAVLRPYNSTVDLRDLSDAPVNHSLSNVSASGVDIFTGVVSVSPSTVKVMYFPDGAVAAGANEDFPALDSPQGDQAVNGSIGVVQLPGGRDGEEGPGNFTDAENVGNESLESPPGKGTVGAEATNASVFTDSSNDSSIFYGIGEIDDNDDGGENVANASKSLSDATLFPNTEGDSLHSQASSFNTTSALQGRRANIVALTNTTDAALLNYSSPDTTKDEVNETDLPIGTIDGISFEDSAFNISNSELDTYADFVSSPAEIIDEALNYSSSNSSAAIDVSLVGVSADSVNIVLFNSSNADTSEEEVTDFVAAPIRTIVNNPSNYSTTNTTSGLKSTRDFATSPDEIIHDAQANFSFPKHTDSKTDTFPGPIAVPAGIDDGVVLHDAFNITNEDDSSTDVVTSRSASEVGEWTTSNALSIATLSDFNESVAFSTASSNSTLGETYSNGNWR